jgi:hypothetical protein
MGTRNGESTTLSLLFVVTTPGAISIIYFVLEGDLSGISEVWHPRLQRNIQSFCIESKYYRFTRVTMYITLYTCTFMHHLQFDSFSGIATRFSFLISYRGTTLCRTVVYHTGTCTVALLM